MVNRSGNIGTAAETAVVKAIKRNGIFPLVERRRLKGAKDEGDLTGTPRTVWSVKGGDYARTATDNKIAGWLEELEKQRVNAGAEIGVLVVQRKNIGLPNADQWWAIVTRQTYEQIMGRSLLLALPMVTMRFVLDDLCWLLRLCGYGEPIDGRSVEQVNADMERPRAGR